MALNDTVIKAAKPRENNWKLADEKGLYLLITPASQLEAKGLKVVK